MYTCISSGKLLYKKIGMVNFVLGQIWCQGSGKRPKHATGIRERCLYLKV